MSVLSPLQLFLLAILLPVFVVSLATWIVEARYDQDPEPR